ncbi:dual specificity protein kinase splB-like [Corticium candelabrum]|uniref:dual specificity protein kinase splB-like n=1 Tax=Corticium candelabrum TaxID=121492 RepID=UPI002E256E5F|nr:dual specificity protein kinase splB-like [Corticium candelabrum]
MFVAPSSLSSTQPPPTKVLQSQPPTITQPPTTKPQTTKLVTTNSPITSPPTTNPPTTKPPTTNPPSTNPPTTNSPTTNPSTTNPPTTNPSTTNPPTTNPSTTNLPTTNPPTTNIPTENVLPTNLSTTNPLTKSPATEVPTTKIPTAKLPTTKPPTTSPLTTNPSTTNSPTADLSTANPPTVNPSRLNCPTATPSTANPSRAVFSTIPNTTIKIGTMTHSTTGRVTITSPTKQDPTMSRTTTTSSSIHVSTTKIATNQQATKIVTTRAPTNAKSSHSAGTQLLSSKSLATTTATVTTVNQQITRMQSTQILTSTSATESRQPKSTNNQSEPTSSYDYTTSTSTANVSDHFPLFTTNDSQGTDKTITQGIKTTMNIIDKPSVSDQPDTNRNASSSSSLINSTTVYIAVSAGGTLLLVVVIVVVIMILRRRRGKLTLGRNSKQQKVMKDNSIYAKNEDICTLQRHQNNVNSDTKTTFQIMNPVFNKAIPDGTSEHKTFVNVIPQYTNSIASSQISTNKGSSFGSEQEDYLEPIITAKVASFTSSVNQTKSLRSEQEEYLEPITTVTPASIASSVKERIYVEPARTEESLYVQLKQWKLPIIDQNTIKRIKELGSGEFGTVYKAKWKKSQQDRSLIVAVKTLNANEPGRHVKFLREAAIMGQFNHKNVVALHGIVLAGKPIMIVFEFLANGDLKEFLVNRQPSDDSSQLPTDTPNRLLRMNREIAAGMKYLEAKSFVHRDLAIRNIMLDFNETCKIGDFGLARDLDDDAYYVTSGGKIPVRWTAPEALEYRKYSTASDVWSYGVVLYEIWSIGQRPFGAVGNKKIMQDILNGYRLPPPPGCPYAIYRLMISCWHPDHHRRPSFRRVVSYLSTDDLALITNKAGEERVLGHLGDNLDVSKHMYKDLQTTYIGMTDQ